MRISLTALTDRGACDLVIDADSEMTVGAVANAVFAAIDEKPPAIPQPRPAADASSSTLWADGRMLDPQAQAVRALRDGAVIATDRRAAAATVLSEPTGLVEVRVAGGPAAGAVHRLGLGAHTLGGGEEVDLAVADPALPPRALQITVHRGDHDDSGVVVEALAPTGAFLDGRPLEGATPWPFGGLLRVGSTVLTLAPGTAPDAHLEPLPDGGLAFNRPPRIGPRSGRPKRLAVPRPPERAPHERLRLLGSLLLSAFGLVMAYATGQWQWALLALGWPVVQIGERASDRMHGRTPYRRALQEYRRRSAAFADELEALRRQDEAERRAMRLDPAEALLTATGPRRRLWERRLTDEDTLHMRVGLADLPARIELVGPPDGAADGEAPIPLTPIPLARTVPVALHLTELGVLGLTGPRSASRALARWMVAQAAVQHSPRDLAIVVLSTEPDAAEHWNWVRWLPHCAPHAGEECVALVGTDPDSVAHRVTELAIRITERRRTRQHAPGLLGGAATGTPEPPYNILVVLDGARALRRVPGMPHVLARGPEYGVYAICIDDEERLLPEECAAVASWISSDTLRLHGHDLEAIGPVLADQVSVAWAERVARALAPIRDVSRTDAAETVPAQVRLPDLLGMPDPTPGHVLDSWAVTGGRSTRVPIGVAADGPFHVDLRADGPHGLVAGTTGAGTSELLQTLIAALAATNRPDELTLVLVDRQGGAAFADCARLPHTVGLVTDLDGHLAERALHSLSAELRRREEILLAAGAEDIDDYAELRARAAVSPAGRHALPHRSGTLPPLPRLMLVIDEFAALAAELPEFMAGLVDIGRRGRRLGVHLILATRRPAGAVTPDIRAATDLRIALRLTDPGESVDVIDSPEAADIPPSAPGRCYVRSGTAMPRAVQSARVSGRRPAARAGASPSIGAPSVRAVPWKSLGRPLPEEGEAADEPEPVTDLTLLVDAIAQAADRAGIPPQRSPWLDPLPDRIRVSLRTAAGGSVVDVPPIEFGVTDLPETQSRQALALDLAHEGHLYVAGAARSGRSTTLRTLAGSLASATSPYDVHLYAIDCGGGALLPLVSLPHCGAVVSHDQLDRCERLLAALSAEVARRRRLLAEAGFATPAEQRATVAPTDRLPWMVLLVDRWEGFLGAFEHYDYGRLVEVFVRLLREGAAVGLRAVVTGDRTGLGGQVSTVFDRRLVLRMADPMDYGYAGLQERQVPADMPPGRALEHVGPGRPVRESQIGLLADDPAGAAQVAALQKIARACRQRYGRPPRRLGPLRVDELPVRVTFEEALALDPDFVAPSALWALVGAGGDTLGPVGVDLLGGGPGFVVAGPPRSGRSTTLLTIVHSLLDPTVGEGLVPVLLLAPRRSPLRELAGRPGVLGVLGADATEDELLEAIGDEPRYVVVADDAELLEGTDLDDALREVLRTARDGEHAVVIGGTTEDLGRGHRGFSADVRRSRSGVLLAARSPDDGELFGLRPPRNAALSGPAGRALLVIAGTATPVQVALPPS